MFDDLKEAFREALDNFNKELSRDHVPETVDKLLYGMKSEIADEKAAVEGVRDQLEKTEAELTKVRQNVDTARRREEMAREIDDDETVKIAAEFATKQERHLEVLERKAEALKEELEFRERTVEEMFARFHEAKERREALSATTGRSGARKTITEADDLFSELDRMAEKIEGVGAEAEAAESFAEIDLGGDSEYHVDVDEPSQREELDVDAALAELKRRMGESS